MRNLPIDTLRTIATINELGSFTRASEVLGRSQPAISLQVQKLEELVGFAIFERSARQMVPTDKGNALLRHARAIVDLNDRAIAELQDSPLSGSLRLGIPSEFATRLLPGILRQFSNRYPQISLEVVTDLSANLLHDQQTEAYDLVLALRDQDTRSGDERLGTDDLVWVDNGTELTPEETVPLVLAPEGCIYRKRALRLLRKAKRDWKIVYTNRDLSGIRSAVEEGIGVTVLARSTVPQGLSMQDSTDLLPELGSIAISLIHRSRTPEAAARRLAQFIQERLRELIGDNWQGRD